MNERLKAWCERRMNPTAGSTIGGYYASTPQARTTLYVREDGSWWIMAGRNTDLVEEASPEKCEAVCSYLGIRLRGVGSKEDFEDTFLLATAALSAAGGIDPTTALALADEVQSRFRYPDITPEWLRELGWRSEGTPHWSHQDWAIRNLKLQPSGHPNPTWRWLLDANGVSASRPLAHRGDLLKLMDLFGHDWKNPPEVKTTRQLNAEMDQLGIEAMSDENIAILQEQTWTLGQRRVE